MELKVVLIVEDDAATRWLYKLLLGNGGCTVLEAKDGVTALEQLSRNHCDLVITDMNMPRMDGMELIQTIRRDYPSVYVIMITGFGTPDTERQAIRRGANDYLAKPFDFEELERRVRTFFSMRSHLEPSLPETHIEGIEPAQLQDLSAICGLADISVITLHIAAPAKAIQKIIQEGVLDIPHAQSIRSLGSADALAILATDRADAALDDLVQRFYEHVPSIEPTAVLTFGIAHSPFPSVDELIVTLARDHADRHQSQLNTTKYTPAILRLEPDRGPLQLRYEQATRLHNSYRTELRKRVDSMDRALRTAIDQLIAIVNHDLTNGLNGLAEAITEIQDNLDDLNPHASQTLTWLHHQLILCIAWQRSMFELGTGGVVRPTLRSFGAWLRHTLPILRDQLSIVLSIQFDNLPDRTEIAFDASLMLVAMFNLLLDAQSAGAQNLWVSVQSPADSSRLIVLLEDDGEPTDRGIALKNASFQSIVFERPQLALFHHALNQQDIELQVEPSSKGFAVRLAFPSPQRDQHGIVSLGELRREVERLELEITYKEQSKVPINDIRTDADSVSRLLAPYLDELVQSLWKLVIAVDRHEVDDHIEDICRRIHPLAMYCYLLARNLGLALKGDILPTEIVDPNAEIQQVLILLEHKINPEAVSIQLELAPDIPRVAMAGVELKQVLMNLIKNALEAMKNTGLLRITTFYDTSHVIIEIQDNGCGIRPEHRKKIYQLNFSTKGRGTDSGVGMYAVQSLVKRAGGQLKAASVTVDSAGKLKAWQSNFGPDEIKLPPRNALAKLFRRAAGKQRLVLDQPGTVFQIVLPIARNT